ncbi:MAG: Rab family GTPase [Cyanobacteria bacterium P01_F01_bin.42]
MIQKKICMIGAFATGKTSLVARFVKGLYSEKYQTTIGVKIDKKVVSTRGQVLNLILWDIYGEDEFQSVRMSYLRGAAGFILVVDGTRYETLNVAVGLKQKVEDAIGSVPFVLIVNKSDLIDEWEISDQDLEDLAASDWDIVRGSAKTGRGVDDCFTKLSEKLLQES